MNEIIKVIVDNGVSVGCVVYLMYFNFVTMKDITKAMNQTVLALNSMNERLVDIEKKIGEK